MIVHHNSTRAPLWRIFSTGLVAIAAFFYFHGIVGNLPYHLDPDEPVYYIAATQIRQTGSNQLKPAYPPLRFYEMALEQAVIDGVSGGPVQPSVYFLFSRAGSAFAALVLLAVIHLIGEKLHSPLAGFLGAGLLAFDYQIVEFSHLARADTWTWLFGSMVVLLTFLLLKAPTRKLWLFTWVMVIAAFLAKYSIALLLLLPFFFLAQSYFHHKILRWAFLAALIATTIVGIGLIVYFRANADLVFPRLKEINIDFILADRLPVLDNLWSSIRTLLRYAGTWWLMVSLSALLVNLVLWRRRLLTVSHLILLTYFAAVIALTIAMFTLRGFRYWDAYHVIILLAICGGLGLAQIANKLGRSGVVLSLGIAAILASPKIIQAWEIGQDATRPQTLSSLGDWFIEHVPQGARTVVENSTPFNSYAGFPGRTIYHQYSVNSLFDETVKAYRERGYEYLIWSSQGEHPSWAAKPDQLSRAAYFEDAELVLELPSVVQKGPYLIVFQLPPIQQHPLYAWFTPAISFRGYDLNHDSFKPGDEVSLTLYWESAQTVPNNYIIFVHILDLPTGYLVAGQDGLPDNGLTPTWKWQGDMQFIRDQRTLFIPADARPGAYTLRIGMYDADTQARVTVLDLNDQLLGDTLVLQEVEIEN